jgi:hypothetical protein
MQLAPSMQQMAPHGGFHETMVTTFEPFTDRGVDSTRRISAAPAENSAGHTCERCVSTNLEVMVRSRHGVFCKCSDCGWRFSRPG